MEVSTFDNWPAVTTMKRTPWDVIVWFTSLGGLRPTTRLVVS
jgi:hypothetical protein